MCLPQKQTREAAYTQRVLAQALPTCSRREAVPCESRRAASATSSCASTPPSWPASAARLLLSALQVQMQVDLHRAGY